MYAQHRMYFGKNNGIVCLTSGLTIIHQSAPDVSSWREGALLHKELQLGPWYNNEIHMHYTYSQLTTDVPPRREGAQRAILLGPWYNNGIHMYSINTVSSRRSLLA